jgi:hypothetical protein
MTWTSAQNKFIRISGDTTAPALVQAKDDMNIGASKFNAALDRYFTRKAKSTDTVATQQYYQTPPDCIRVIGVTNTLSNGRKYPVRQIRSEYEWRAINTIQQTGNWATYYFVRGADEIGLWPIPSQAVTNGLEIYYEPRDHQLTQEDYTTGTVTVTNGSTTVTGSGTTFTNTMVGRIFQVTDGSDGYNYKVTSYSSSTVLTLEEPYIGLSGSSRTYSIGESFIFPEEYHDAPVDFALGRYFEVRNNAERATYHNTKYQLSVADAKAKYSSSSSSQVITEEAPAYNFWQLPPSAATGTW